MQKVAESVIARSYDEPPDGRDRQPAGMLDQGDRAGRPASAPAPLPAPGERAAVIGCGSSLNVARCYAALREAAGQGETDAFPASEAPSTRRYDRMVFVSRTGTTHAE